MVDRRRHSHPGPARKGGGSLSVWEDLAGQEQACRLLRRLAPRPPGALLIAGPPGSGLEGAARAFAAALVCPQDGCGSCSACRRVRLGRHPDVLEVEALGQAIVSEQIEDATREAFASPFEADRKVVLVLDADRLNEPAASRLLKLLEEPPPRTHLVLVTAAADELLETVRSRCLRVDLGALGDSVVERVLLAEGLDQERAPVVVGLVGGDLGRARALAGPWWGLRQAAALLPQSLDGSGGSVARAAEALRAATEAALLASELGHQREAADLEAELGSRGYPERTAKRLRKELEARHTRSARRSRHQVVAEAVVAIESRFRDLLATPAPARNSDMSPLRVPPATALLALQACARVRASLEAHPTLNDALILEHLLLELPARSRPPGAGRVDHAPE